MYALDNCAHTKHLFKAIRKYGSNVEALKVLVSVSREATCGMFVTRRKEGRISLLCEAFPPP